MQQAGRTGDAERVLRQSLAGTEVVEYGGRGQVRRSCNVWDVVSKRCGT